MNSAKTELVPRKLLFSDPERSAVKISPDGSRLIWLAPFDGVLNIWIAPRDNPAAASVLTRDDRQGIRHSLWSHNPDIVLYARDKDGDENWHFYAVDVTGGEPRDLTPFAGINAKFIARSASYPDEIVVGINHRNPWWHDIYRINIVTGARTLLLEHDRFLDVVFDHELQLRFATEMRPDGGYRIYQLLEERWQAWQDVPAEDLVTTGIEGFDQSGEVVFMRDSRNRDTSALVAVDLATGAREILAEDSRVDLHAVLRHPTGRQVQAASFIHARSRWEILDASIEADFARLRDAAEGDFSVINRSRDDRYWIVLFTRDNGPPRFYLYDRQDADIHFLFSSKPGLDALSFSQMHSVIIEARDGLELLGYYSLPPGSDSEREGIPDKPLPLVFTPHGGPWQRDHWGFHPWHQWLTNRGYAVLSINFRASTGFGKSFVNAGDREWGGKIIADQQDAVGWAIDAGIADAQRLAILGISFGGYSVLAGMAFSPQRFACGIDLVGVANLITWFESIPEYWKPLLPMIKSRVGDPDSQQGRALLEKQSPINHADRICRPLLVGQGANDPRVRTAESDQIVQALEANGIPVTYAIYPDEGHGFGRPQNRQSFHALVEAFLAKHIGGRYEAIGSDLVGASLEVPTGAEHVPGLPEALRAVGKG